MAQVAAHWLPTVEGTVQFQASLCGICGGWNALGTIFSPNTAIFLCQLPFQRCSILIPHHLWLAPFTAVV